MHFQYRFVNVCDIKVYLQVVKSSSFNETMLLSVTTLAQGGKYCIAFSWRQNLQKITTMENDPLFLVPCNLGIYKNVPIWMLNLIAYAKDCRTIFSFPHEGGGMVVFSSFSLSSSSKIQSDHVHIRILINGWCLYRNCLGAKKIPWLLPHYRSWAFDFSARGFFVCCPVNSGYSVEMGQSLLTSSGLLGLRMTKEI